MKIITWNCQGAYRKKAALIAPHLPDIVVVPECEHPDKLVFKADILIPTDVLWYGENPNKGLGVFSYSDYKFQLLDWHNSAHKNILPIAVTGGKIDFLLIAVWANNPKDPANAYITQVWRALLEYEHQLKGQHVVLAGDFNSNTIWDRPKREGNHTTVVKRLENHEIFSTYHHHFNQIQGQEAHPTFFLHRSAAKPYHLDYCFASKVFMEALTSVEVGKFDDFIGHSDHLPLFCNFNT